MLISVMLMMCFVSVAHAANLGSDGQANSIASPNGNVITHTTNLGSDGQAHATASPAVNKITKRNTKIADTAIANAAIPNAASANVGFTPIATTGNCIDNTKKVAVYMPSLMSTVTVASTGGTTQTDVTYDPLCTAMFFEYNPDYLNDSTITSRLTKSNYDMLVVPMSEMNNKAATAINNYLSNGGSVWFLSDPSIKEDKSVKLNRITILGKTADSNYNTISSASTIKVDNTDNITAGLPSQFHPVGCTEKWSFFRSFSNNAGTISGFNYKVLMSTGDCAMLIKFENTTTGARVIYSNVNMFVSGGDCSYFDAATATKLFLLTKAWMLNLGINTYGAEITYPTNDKQFTISIDDVYATSIEPKYAKPFFDMETSNGVNPASVNTFFIIPISYTTKASLQNYSNNGDTHTLHPHEITVWDNSQTVSKYMKHISTAKGIINKAAGVTDYGFTSWRFPYTSYCFYAQKAVVSSGFVIDSSNGRFTNGVSIGTPEDNNLLFPKQMLLDNAKKNVVELEATSVFDLDATDANDYYQQQLENFPYLQNVNFPANFVVGAHYQGIMNNTSLRTAMSQILSASKTTGTSYITFDKLSKYLTGIKGAQITASNSGNIVTIKTNNQIDNFTIKLANVSSVSGATYDGSAIPSSGIIHDGNVWYVTKTVDKGTHTFVIEP
jgi:hypothetical protein